MKIYMKRESSMLYGTLHDSGRKTHFWCRWNTRSLQLNLSSAFKLYPHWNTLLSSTGTFSITADSVI